MINKTTFISHNNRSLAILAIAGKKPWRIVPTMFPNSEILSRRKRSKVVTIEGTTQKISIEANY